MYALVKQSGKYDVIEKKLIINKNIRAYSKLQYKSKIHKDEQLIAYNGMYNLLLLNYIYSEVSLFRYELYNIINYSA